MLTYLAAAITGYLFGSVSFAIWAGNAVRGIDVRSVGSRNAGTSNVFTEIGPKWGILTFFADVAKALVPLMIARYFFHAPNAVLITIGLGVIAGHDFPAWYGFKGGKGTASTIAVAFGLHWIAGFIVLAALLVVAIVTDSMAIAGMVSALIFPLALLIVGYGLHLGMPALAVPALSVYLHRSNIRKLLDGTEPSLLGALKKSGTKKE